MMIVIAIKIAIRKTRTPPMMREVRSTLVNSSLAVENVPVIEETYL